MFSFTIYDKTTGDIMRTGHCGSAENVPLQVMGDNEALYEGSADHQTQRVNLETKELEACPKLKRSADRKAASFQRRAAVAALDIPGLRAAIQNAEDAGLAYFDFKDQGVFRTLWLPEARELLRKRARKAHALFTDERIAQEQIEGTT